METGGGGCRGGGCRRRASGQRSDARVRHREWGRGGGDGGGGPLAEGSRSALEIYGLCYRPPYCVYTGGLSLCLWDLAFSERPFGLCSSATRPNPHYWPPQRRRRVLGEGRLLPTVHGFDSRSAGLDRTPTRPSTKLCTAPPSTKKLSGILGHGHAFTSLSSDPDF